MGTHPGREGGDLPLLTKNLVLLAQLPQLLAFFGSKPLALSLIYLGLFNLKFLKEVPEIPRSLAICGMDLPEERTSCMASALNSGGY